MTLLWIAVGVLQLCSPVSIFTVLLGSLCLGCLSRGSDRNGHLFGKGQHAGRRHSRLACIWGSRSWVGLMQPIGVYILNFSLATGPSQSGDHHRLCYHAVFGEEMQGNALHRQHRPSLPPHVPLSSSCAVLVLGSQESVAA